MSIKHVAQAYIKHTCAPSDINVCCGLNGNTPHGFIKYKTKVGERNGYPQKR